MQGSLPMNSTNKLDEILERLHSAKQELEQELDRILAKKRKQFQYSIRRGKVVFERNTRNWQRQHQTSLWQFLRKSPMPTILLSPVIYGMIIPLTFLDLSISIYQHTCFRSYGIPLVRRADYLIIDRQNLAYLNAIEKFNCIYCGYGNGLMEFAREVIARTEQYWCPIKHAQRTMDPHKHTQDFFDYGDAESWKQNLTEIRQNLRQNKTKKE